jgi:ABC-type amino acid transport substrate-binding protein
MTTVGYGDKTPMTPLGRALALIWMLVGILLISAFTATVASTVAWSRTSTAVYQISDLARFKAGVMEASAARSQLMNVGIPSTTFQTVDGALEALREAHISVFVADFVTIRYELNTRRWSDIRAAVLHGTSAQMAIPVRKGLPELEAINVAILETISEPAWQGILRRWIGDPIPQDPKSRQA